MRAGLLPLLLFAALIAVLRVSGLDAADPELSEPQALSQCVRAAIAKVSPATVAIVASGRRAYRVERSFTGTVVDDRLVLTDALNVINSNGSVRVTDAEGRHREGVVVGKDLRLRVAGILVKGPPFKARISATEDLRVGRFALALGRGDAPGPGPAIASLGIVSALNRFSGRAIQVSCGLNTGNNGGPVVGLDGRSFGLAILLDSRNGQDSGVGFVVPWRALRPAIRKIRLGEDVHPAYFGLLVPENDVAGVRGIPIAEVVPESPAAKAGLKKTDLVLELGGRPVTTIRAMNEAMVGFVAGDAVTLKFLRGTKTAVTTVVTTRRP